MDEKMDDAAFQLNGMRVFEAHFPVNGQPATRTRFVVLPRALWRSCGVCHCPICRGAEGFWDTLAVPEQKDPKHREHAYTVHYPELRRR